MTTFENVMDRTTNLMHMIMKNHMKKILTALICFVFSLTVSAQSKTDVKNILGEWTYSAPDAPYGYENGKVNLAQEKGKLLAKVNIQGNILIVKDFTITENMYKATFFLDGAYVCLTFKEDGNVLKGEATAEGMEIPVTFKRIKK